MARTKSTDTKDSTANLGFEQKLWLATFEDNCHSFRTLATLTDTLPPNLLSGELTVEAPLRESILSKESVADMPGNKDGMGPMDSPKEPTPR